MVRYVFIFIAIIATVNAVPTNTLKDNRDSSKISSGKTTNPSNNPQQITGQQDSVRSANEGALNIQQRVPDARTHLGLLKTHKGFGDIHKGYGELSSYGSYDAGYHEAPVLQPIVHQKPVLFHQEVIKPIVHEVVKPLPVFHETVKPIVHEVVKTMPIVKEVVKPVPVEKVILKPYTVPVVHPVQFHKQPTHISVPMEWSCQLVPGHGGPVVGGIESGYGSYGSSSGLSDFSSGYASGLSGLSGVSSYNSLGGLSSYGSYGLQGGLGHRGYSSLGSYSVPIKTLPPKYIGGHLGQKFKSSDEPAFSGLEDEIQNLIQQEELSITLTNPPDMNMRSNQLEQSPFISVRPVVSQNSLSPTQLPNRWVTPQSQMRAAPMGWSSASLGQFDGNVMQSFENEGKSPKLFPKSVPMDQSFSAGIDSRVPMNYQVLLNAPKSAQVFPISALDQSRSAMMGLPLNQMQLAEMDIPASQMRAADLRMVPNQLQAGQIEMNPGQMLPAAEMNMSPQQLRSAEALNPGQWAGDSALNNLNIEAQAEQQSTQLVL